MRYLDTGQLAINMIVAIKELKELPPLSSSAREILKIINNDDADIDEITQIVERDPVLISRIIGLANSAFFGSRSVTKVRRAIIDILGFRTAKNIILGIVLGGIFNPKQCPAFDLPKYWFLSLMTATLAREIAIKLKMSYLDADEAYLSGILNEIGLMALAYLHPLEMGQVLRDIDYPLLENEKAVFGQSHYEISASVMRDWRVPEVVSSVMIESDLTQDPAMKCSDLCHIICLTKNLATMIYDEIPTNLAEISLPGILSGQAPLIEATIEEASGQVEAYREMARLLS